MLTTESPAAPAAPSARPWRVLLTGAAGGMGRAIALALADQARRDGRALHLAAAGSRRNAALEALRDALQAAGAACSLHAADLADADACARLVVDAAAAAGGLDLLVSNAGVMGSAPLATLDVATWDHVFAVDVRATWLLARAAHPALRASRGAIVAIASVSAHQPFPGLGAYSPAKAALLMLCRQLAQEWAGDGIRVNSVSPGLVRTPLTEAVYADAARLAAREQAVPLHRIATPEDVARAVLTLAGPELAYATGIDLRLDGGLLDSVLATVPGRPGAPRAD